MAATLDARLRLDSSQFSGGMDRALREANSFTGKLSAQFATLKNLAIGGAVGSFATDFVGGIMQATMEAEKLKAALTATTGNKMLGVAAFEDVKKLSGEIGLDVQDAAKAMIQFQSAGMSAADSLNAIKAGFNAIVSTGGGSNEFGRFAVAIQQLRNSPKPLQEEINQLREALPTTAKLMKEAFGANRAEDLQKLGISGKQFVNTLVEAMEKLPQIGDTMEKRIGRLKVKWKDLATSLGERLEPATTAAMTGAGWLLDVSKKAQQLSDDAIDKVFGGELATRRKQEEQLTQFLKNLEATKHKQKEVLDEELRANDVRNQSISKGTQLSLVMNKVAGTINRLGDEFRRTNIAAEQFADAMQRAADSERDAVWQASLDATRAQLSDSIMAKRERQAEADNTFVGPRQQSPEEANAWRELARREAMTKEDRRSFRQQQREEKENFRKAADRKSRDEFREEQRKARERAFDDQKNGKFFDAEGTRRSIREKNRAEAEQARKDGNQILKDIWTELKRLATA